MIVQSWRVESDYTKPMRWFQVQVHDSLLSLRRSAARYDFTTFAEYADAIGCCQQVSSRWEETGSGSPTGPLWPKDGRAGVIRFSVDHLFTEVIYHEIVHAAAVIYRLNVAQDIQLGMAGEDMSAEENFAYIYGQLAADMDTQLRKHFDFGNWGKVS